MKIAVAMSGGVDSSSAAALLKKLDEAAKEHYIPPLNRAKIYLGPGETKKVFEWLEKDLRNALLVCRIF